ncbi:ferritin-like domain-containing protein [Baekduia soli]|uniref:Ferritin-like domain-containing protein n=1 Tax=Baekduia soli TaxID=496014 RepID=A0A5B8U591_9ACTN|nr:ferritin-like domain-containing protein [Baekduia soli]QEC48289.1 ferritin-like domain-containing protein [Baekduia soli]
MSDSTNHLYDEIDRQNQHLPASSRRGLIKGTAASLAGMGLFGLMSASAEAKVSTNDANKAENILAVAATAEVLATIVNTVGPEKLGSQLDAVTRRNVQAAAQQEKNHYELLTSKAVGGKEVTKTIYVPDEVFASKENLLKTLVVGDQVFINAYLLGVTVFARQGTLSGSKFARYAAEIMATEAVHRAVALQSLGELGNDRVYAKFAQREEVAGLPTTGAPGFYDIMDAVTVLESAGFGFGKPGSKPGTAYNYDEVAARTPVDPGVNTISIS